MGTTNFVIKAQDLSFERFELEYKRYWFEIKYLAGSKCWCIDGCDNPAGRAIHLPDRHNWRLKSFTEGACHVRKFLEKMTGLRHRWFVGWHCSDQPEDKLLKWCASQGAGDIYCPMGKSSTFTESGRVFNTLTFDKDIDVNRFIEAHNCEWGLISHNIIPYHVARCSDQGTPVSSCAAFAGIGKQEWPKKDGDRDLLLDGLNSVCSPYACDCGAIKHGFCTHVTGCPQHPDEIAKRGKL